MDRGTPLCIGGMHRSGTSMVTRVLHLLGLHLGDEQQLVPPGDDNPDGYWEHRRIVELNDALLAGLGGGWDDPPPPTPGWRLRDAADDLRAEAEQVLAEIQIQGPWGWKDPRVSLTLPFWANLVPGLRTVICVRHPLEVAMSLRRRGMFSFALSFRLWQTYNERLLDAIGTGAHLTVHYAAVLDDPVGQLDRLAAFSRVDPSAEARAAAEASIRRRPGRQRFDVCDLRDAGATPAVLDLYALLCREAGWASDAEAPRSAMAVLGPAREQLQRWSAIQEPDAAPAYDRSRERVDRLEELVGGLGSTVATHASDLHRRLDDVQQSLYDLWGPRDGHGSSRHEDDYRAVVRRARAAVRELVPRTSRCLVAAKGDAQLLEAFGRDLGHFPQLVDGEYTGHHPAGDLAAIANLSWCRAFCGYDHLFIPAPQLWWLDHYRDFAAHLRDHHREVWRSGDTGVLFELGGVTRSRRCTIISDVLDQLRTSTGREPIVLDTGSGVDRADLPPATTVFEPPSLDGPLPYLDGTVDVVLCSTELLDEATRVASAVAIVVSDTGVETVWLTNAGTLPSVSIVIPTYRESKLLAACLRSVTDTLPRWLDVEVIVVDDASPGDPYLDLADLFDEVPGLRLLRNEQNEGFLGSAMRGAEEATGEILVFLNNDTVVLPGWLTPLLSTVAEPGVGAVGGRLLYPDGTLQEAGAMVFSDGSAAKVGYGDPDPQRVEYEHRRVVDYCSGALLATPRQLFFAMGGFDRRYGPGFYEDTDYCTALRASGRTVVYEPQSAVVHVEGGTAGTDLEQGMKRYQRINQHHFMDRWSDHLAGQPSRPEQEDPLTLIHLTWQQQAASDVMELLTPGGAG